MIYWFHFILTTVTLLSGLNDNKVHWPRGKGLGGTSLLNFVVHSKGHPKDYDLWGAMGNDGWSYKDVLPYLKRMENAKVKNQDEEYRGHDGDLHAEDLHFRHKCAEVFLNAAKDNGHEEIDYNGKTPTGISFTQQTTRNGLRCSGERCLLRPIKTRKNLTIRLNSHVTKVLIDSSSKKAYGVEFIKDGKKYVALAKKEVILSGGTVNSAQILMLSGVGPREGLERVGIDVVKELPVGKKVLDHVLFLGLPFTTEEPLFCYDQSKITDPREYVKLFNGEKSYLHISGVEAQLFYKSNVSNDVDDYPDIEIGLLSPFIGSDNGVFKTILNLKDDTYQQYLKASSETVFGLAPVLLHPESHGRIELKSSDPFDHPNIYAGYFTDAKDRDMRTMIAGIVETLKIADHREFRNHGVKLMDLQLPVCKDHIFGSDAYWRCAVQQLSTTTFHPVSSCKMGPSHDPEAVVDSRLRVYGIQNLRVADAGVIPVTISGHTNLPSYLVGEKGAEMITEDWSQRRTEL